MAVADYFGNLGSNMVDGVLGTVASGLLAEHNARINYKYNEMAAENADKRQRALYNDFESPEARIRQLKEAGLSPSLYANGAGGGNGGIPTSAQGSGASGVGMPTGLMDMQSLAETRLMNAQAEKAEEEAKGMRGENASGKANIAKAWADAGLSKAYTNLTNVQTNIAKINEHIADETQNFSIAKTRWEMERTEAEATKIFWEGESANLQWQFDQQTFTKRVEKVANEAAELAARTAMERSQQRLNDEERKWVKETVSIALMNASAHVTSAQAYGDYIDTLKETLPQQLKLREKEIGLKKWEIGVDAFNNLVRTAGYVFGATQLGDGGYMVEEETQEPVNSSEHMRTTKKKTTQKTRFPKTIK